ncbi:hypothetical protein FXB41_03780 [Bradyrhizobium canariense]|nr:hypothetical protein [Bradyrhizobium canariense]
MGNLLSEAGGVEMRHALHPHHHCERSEAIQSASAERLWIASLRSQRRRMWDECARFRAAED